MGNHYHLLIETVDPTLSRGMQHINGIYTQWYNVKRDRVGHMFQGRFKAFLIEEHAYLLNVARYVVLNPVRAKMVMDPENYNWSSYRVLAGISKAPDWLTTTNILRQFSDSRTKAQELYKKYVHEGVGLPSPMIEAGKGGILGSAQFIDEMRDKINEKISDKDIVVAKRMEGRPTLQELFEDVKDKKERNTTIVLAVCYLHYSAVEVGRLLGLDGSSVARIVKRENTRYQR